MDIDDCEFHACENDATCLDGVDTYSCACASGFTGEFCELQIGNLLYFLSVSLKLSFPI